MTNSKTSYLLDASALYPLLLKLGEELLDHASRFTVLDLTVYEVGNTVWKEHKKGRIKDPHAAATLFQELFKHVKIMSTNGKLTEILETAISENLTFYDASYLHASRKTGLKLVTEDNELLKYPESINTHQLLKDL